MYLNCSYNKRQGQSTVIYCPYHNHDTTNKKPNYSFSLNEKEYKNKQNSIQDPWGKILRVNPSIIRIMYK